MSVHLLVCSCVMIIQLISGLGTDVSGLLLLLFLQDSRQIFTTPSKSSQTSQNFVCIYHRYRKCHVGRE